MRLAMGPVDVGARRIGLVVVDEINGFATVGADNLVPPVESPQVDAMVCEADRLAFLATHAPGKAEPPCPPHCDVEAGLLRRTWCRSWLSWKMKAMTPCCARIASTNSLA
jgi:hypothetical protein